VTYAALGPDAALLCDNDLTCSCSFFFFLFSFFLNASDHRLDPKSERKTKEAEVNKAKRNKTKPSVAETAKNAHRGQTQSRHCGGGTGQSQSRVVGKKTCLVQTC
jgi:hypothetical protein